MGVISPVEIINLVGIISLEEAISPADRTAQASNLMEAEGGTTREVEVVGEDTNCEQTDAYTVLANESSARVCFIYFFPLL